MARIDAGRLNTAMRLAGVSSEQLAAAVGITEGYMSMIRHGRRAVDRNPVLRRKIADALGVPVDWIETKEPN